MLTDQLFEHWNIDAEALVRQVRPTVPDGDLFLGGSLADDLGHPGSDIDLYRFVNGPTGIREGPILIPFGDLFIELHVVDAVAAASRLPDLRPLLTSEMPLPPDRWPLLSGPTMRIFYALYCDRRIDGGGKVADGLRYRTGVDLLHIAVALRSTLTTQVLLDDVRTFTMPEHRWTVLYLARLMVESAIDAALASVGLVNPNPKWRLLLVERAVLGHPGFPSMAELLPALFPEPSNCDAMTMIQNCVAAARKCLVMVQADGLLSFFPVVPETLTALSAQPAASVAGGPDAW